MAVNTYERKRGIDSNDVEIVGGVQKVDVAKAVATGMGLPDDKGIEIDTAPVYSSKALDEEAFAREMVEIHMHDAANEDEPMFAELTVNGDYALVVRGETKTLRRYHVADLCNAKQMRLVQTKITNPDGTMGYQERAVLRMTYPFSVIHDPNPKGAAWLRQLLHNPA